MGEGGKEEGAKRIQGPGPKYHDQHRAFHGSGCLHPASIVRPPFPPWQLFGFLSRILTLQWGIVQIKGDTFGTLPSWHFAIVGGRRKNI